MVFRLAGKKRKFERRSIFYVCTAVIVFFTWNGSILSTPGKNQDKKKDKEKKNTEIIHEIEVVAKREPGDRFKTDRSVSIMNRETMREQNPRTVPEALHDTPGTFVQQTNMGGGSPIIRGMIGPQLLIRVDGVRFNNSTYRTGPGQYLNLIDPLSVERIEILRGPGSVLYGSDAMGGVIDMTLLSGRDTPANREISFSGDLLSRYQSANRGALLHGHFNVGNNNFTFLGGGGYKHFNDLRGGRGIGVQSYVGYDHTSALGKVVRRFSKSFFKDWSLTVGYMFSNIADAGRTDKLYDNNSLQIYDNIDHLVYSRVRMAFPTLRTEGNITLSYQDFFERIDTSKVEDDHATVIDTIRDEVTAGTLGVDIHIITKLKEMGLRMSYGLMWYRDSVGAKRFNQKAGEAWRTVDEQNYPDGSIYTNYGVYTFIQSDPVHLNSGGFFRLSGGYRIHGIWAKVPEKGELPPVDFSHTGHVFLFSAQYLYREQLNMSLTFSQGFRSPNLQESVMLGDTGKFFHVPNYQLKPEWSDSVEFTARGRFGSLTLTWAGYITFLRSLIKREGTMWDGKTEIGGKEVVHNVNAGKGVLWGTEGSFLLGLSGSLSCSGHFTYTWGEENVPSGENIPLTRIPPLFGQLKIRYDILKRYSWQGFVETYIRAAAKQDHLSMEDIKDVRIPNGGTPGWCTWNVRIGVLLPDRVRITLGVENIFNKKYKYHASGIYSPGTGVVLTLEIF
jgi:hemoglobin/transferrin/lactoferrin receptor protein